MDTNHKINLILDTIKLVNEKRALKKQELYTLNPVVQEKTIEEFETRYNITLPEEYRAFLLKIGNGNNETYSRQIYTFEQSINESLNSDGKSDVEKKFPFTQKMGEKIYKDIIYKYYPVDFVHRYTKKESYFAHGCLIINYEGVSTSHTALVVNGSESGRIWIVYDMYYPFRKRFDDDNKSYSFLDWVLYWLDAELSPSYESMFKTNKNELTYLDLQGESQEWQKNTTINDILECSNLVSLNLSRCYKIKELPESIGKLKKLREFVFDGGSLTKLPDSIIQLKMLEILDLGYQQLKSLPNEIGNLTNLKRLLLHWNPELKEIPESVSRLKKIVYLTISYTPKLNLKKTLRIISQLPLLDNLYLDAKKIPDEIGLLNNIISLTITKGYHTKKAHLSHKLFELKKLKYLHLNNCGIDKLSNKINELTNLKELWLSDNNLTTLPKSIGQLSKLEVISISNNDIKYLPNEFSQLKNLSTIEFYNNPNIDLSNVFSVIKGLKKITYLNLYDCGQIPSEIGDLKYVKELVLEFADIIKIAIIPNEIGKLNKLNLLRISTNNELELPETINKLKKLDFLSLESSSIKLPKSLDGLDKLSKFIIRGGKIKKLPDGIKKLKSLKTLEIYENSDLDWSDTFNKLSGIQSLVELHIETDNVPSEIGLCIQLEKLIIDNNTEDNSKCLKLDDELGSLIKLKHLTLEDQKLTELPIAICSLEGLCYLNISYCNINTLPPEFAKLKNLEILECYDSSITFSDEFIKSMPNLKILCD